jgi:hypothetical protein
VSRLRRALLWLAWPARAVLLLVLLAWAPRDLLTRDEGGDDDTP